MTDQLPPPSGPPAVAGPAGDGDQRVHVVIHQPPSTGWRARVPWLRAFQLSAVVAVIGVSLSGFALWHQSAYVPSTLPADLSVSVQLGDPKPVPESEGLGDLRQFEAVVHVKNAGSRRVTVLAAQYNLWGARLVQRNGAEFDAALPKEQGFCSTPFGGRYLEAAADSWTMLATGRMLDGSWLDAGQETDERVILFARPSEADVAMFSVDLWVAKGDVIQTDDEPTNWTAGELAGDSAAGCRPDLEGDLTVRPIYWTYWRVENRTPVLGSMFPDERRLAVEWRPATMVGHLRSSGATCDPMTASDNATAVDPCELSEQLSGARPASFIEPEVVYCAKAGNPASCHLASTMPLKTLLDLEHDLGLAVSSASAYQLLWPEP